MVRGRSSGARGARLSSGAPPPTQRPRAATLSEVGIEPDLYSGDSRMSVSGAEYTRRIKQQINEVDPSEVHELVTAPNGAANGNGHHNGDSPLVGVAIVDVRETDEYSVGHLPGAKHVPRGYLESRIEGAVPDRSQRVILYCASGNRSALAAHTLERGARLRERRVDDRRHHAVEGPRLRGRGPADVHARAARALLAPLPRSPRSASRASRSCSTRRCCCSAPAASARRPRSTSRRPASARSASSTTTWSTSRTSSARSSTRPTASASPKVDSAEEPIKALNPDVDVVKYQTRLDASNIMEIIEGYDIIVDGVDNFPTRYLLNDATRAPRASRSSRAAILGFEGQLSVFHPYEGPCYRCLFPQPPPAELAPSCGANGVLGVLPGTMGLLQATEVVKLIIGAGDPLDRPAADVRRARRDDDRAQGPPRPRVPDLLARARRDRRRGDGRLPRLRGVLRRRWLGCADRSWRRSRSHPSCAPPPAASARSRPTATTSARCSNALADDAPGDEDAALRRRRRAQPLRQRLPQRRGRPRARRARDAGRRARTRS